MKRQENIEKIEIKLRNDVRKQYIQPTICQTTWLQLNIFQNKSNTKFSLKEGKIIEEEKEEKNIKRDKE